MPNAQHGSAWSAGLPATGPFVIDVPEAELTDLNDRLAATRWPSDAPDAGWRYGAGLADVRRLVELWQAHDWRATEARLARHDQVRVDCGGQILHAMRVRADAPAGTVLLLHGWPSSFLEMLDLAELLARPDPVAYDVIVASLPGFAFSGPLAVPGPSGAEIADMLIRLLEGLGVDRVWIHAYDIAASAGVRMALTAPQRVLGYHTTEPGLPRAVWPPADLTEPERAYLRYADEWDRDEGGYMAMLSTRPHTLAYGLTDSPVGLAAWLFEKWWSWTLQPGQGWDWTGPLTRTLLDTLTLYWVTGSVSGANRTYYRADIEGQPIRTTDRVAQPVGVARTTQAIEHAPRELAERLFANIGVWNDLGLGGHFIAAERPDLIAASLRTLMR
ncbi:Epoxide hydrolase N terminus [Glycomyces harbinensis]|uniref:Epoxide hydrolase N terminus n=1 Tax=Glycomyces harbinensis TaxID=58114 RepID=A0A1G6XI71_9ACTN|nr:Epoxide hydrolase N terminus [Glycomyces harbinensis]